MENSTTTTTTTKITAATVQPGMTIRVTEIMESYGDLVVACGTIRKSSPVVTVAATDSEVVLQGGGAFTSNTLRNVNLTLTDGRTVRISSRQKVEVVA